MGIRLRLTSAANSCSFATDCTFGARFTPSVAALLRETVEKLQNCQPGGALLLEGKAWDWLLSAILRVAQVIHQVSQRITIPCAAALVRSRACEESSCKEGSPDKCSRRMHNSPVNLSLSLSLSVS